MFLASGNPFINAYLQSDWFGKWIFLALFLLSSISWIVIIHRSWIFFNVSRLARDLISQFSEKEPLNLQFQRPMKGRFLELSHPFFEIYKSFKQKALSILSRNHFIAPGKGSYFSESDLSLLDAQLDVSIGTQMKLLEKHIFLLSTVMTLGPFLGLLGTVWGILMTFSQMQVRSAGVGSANLLAGISLALAATVIGLIVAIPALIGSHYLKNKLKELRREMEAFSYLLLASLELRYPVRNLPQDIDNGVEILR